MRNLQYFFSFYKPHKKLFIADIICALIVALCNLFYPNIVKNIINIYVPNKALNLIIIWCIVLFFIYVVKLFLNYFIQYYGHIVGVRIQGDMRQTMFEKLEKLPFNYYDNNKTGTIMSRIINDLMDISELAHHGPEDLFLSIITFIGAFIMLCTINIYLALIILCIVPLIVSFAIYRRKKQKQAFKEMRIKTGEINSQVESSVAGIRVLKAYNALEYEKNKFKNSNLAFQDARAKAYKQMGIFNSGMNFFTDFLYLVAIFSGGLFFYFEIIDIGELTAYILYIATLINPIRTFINIFEQIQSGMTGFERFVEIMHEEEEKEDKNPLILKNFNEEIEYKNINFNYKKNLPLVLKNFSLKIKKGSTIALVGPTGGGKTTICHLLPRFYEINDGIITIDGIDIKKFTFSSLREHIGIVAQDVFLFAGTVKENIAYGKPNATEEEIIEAAKKANIHEFIMSLEFTYDTYVGERGVKLSGGQKQRISIARAFLKNPEILILDEATSALDNVTEMQIQQALENLCQGRTTIVVAHRLSTVKKADEIIVINDGEIKEKGTHDSLIKLNGI